MGSAEAQKKPQDKLFQDITLHTDLIPGSEKKTNGSFALVVPKPAGIDLKNLYYSPAPLKLSDKYTHLALQLNFIIDGVLLHVFRDTPLSKESLKEIETAILAGTDITKTQAFQLLDDDKKKQSLLVLQGVLKKSHTYESAVEQLCKRLPAVYNQLDPKLKNLSAAYNISQSDITALNDALINGTSEQVKNTKAFKMLKSEEEKEYLLKLNRKISRIKDKVGEIFLRFSTSGIENEGSAVSTMKAVLAGEKDRSALWALRPMHKPSEKAEQAKHLGAEITGYADIANFGIELTVYATTSSPKSGPLSDVEANAIGVFKAAQGTGVDANPEMPTGAAGNFSQNVKESQSLKNEVQKKSDEDVDERRRGSPNKKSGKKGEEEA